MLEVYSSGIIKTICHTFGLKEVFSTFYTAFHIATIIPVTMVPHLNITSKLKIIKNRLRNAMAQVMIDLKTSYFM